MLLNGRPGNSLWGEPIVPGMGFHLAVNPWPARRPDDLSYPGFAYARFDVAHWQKFERLLAHARARDLVVSVILDWADSKEHPRAGGEDERRYYRYAAARLWVDRILEPAATRDALLLALEVATRHDDGRPFKTGVLQV